MRLGRSPLLGAHTPACAFEGRAQLPQILELHMHSLAAASLRVPASVFILHPRDNLTMLAGPATNPVTCPTGDEGVGVRNNSGTVTLTTVICRLHEVSNTPPPCLFARAPRRHMQAHRSASNSAFTHIPFLTLLLPPPPFTNTPHHLPPTLSHQLQHQQNSNNNHGHVPNQARR